MRWTMRSRLQIKGHLIHAMLVSCPNALYVIPFHNVEPEGVFGGGNGMYRPI